MIVRVSVRDREDTGVHEGYLYFSSMTAAQEWLRQDPERSAVAQIDGTAYVPKNAAEAAELLNLWGKHPDNG